MADWHLAPSLVALRTEVNRRWPNRDKASDGALGDASHSARKSDHNPDYSEGGVVRATDTDKDGINVTEFLAAVVRDPRVAYVIWNKRIASATDDGTPWDWEPYNGTNDHTHHVHVSIKHTRAAETNTSKWFKTTTPPEDDMSAADVKQVNAYTEKRLDDYFTWMSKNITQQLAPLKKAVAELATDEPAKANLLASFDVVDLPKPAVDQ